MRYHPLRRGAAEGDWLQRENRYGTGSHVPLVIADEPGAWEVNGGQLMADAILTAQGKPGSPLKLIIIGTLAPAEAGWWHDMIDAGTGGSVYVQALRGNPEKWD